jgi:hypothetical protein
MSDDDKFPWEDLPEWQDDDNDAEASDDAMPDPLAWLDAEEEEDTPSPGQTGLTSDLPWMSEDDQARPGDASQHTGVTGELPWMAGEQDRPGEPSSGQTGVTGDLPWMDTPADDDFELAEPEFDALDWLEADEKEEPAPSPTPAAPEVGESSIRRLGTSDESDDDDIFADDEDLIMPDWLDDEFEFDDEEEPAPAEEPAFDVPDWLSEEVTPSEEEEMEEPTPPSAGIRSSSISDIPDWLQGEAEPEEAPPPPPAPTSPEPQIPQAESTGFTDWLSESTVEDEQVPSDETGRSSEFTLPDWLDEKDQEEEPAPSSTPSAIRRLGEMKQKPTPQDAMTFDEWERLQEEAQQAAEKPPIDEQDQIPDWFRDNLEIGDAASEIADLILDEEEVGPTAEEESEEAGPVDVDANYVPDWFMGLEEHSLDEAPDWVKETDTGQLGTESLLDVSSLIPPEPEEAAPTETSPGQPAATGEEDDWVAGLGIERAARQPEESDLPATGSDDDSPDWLRDIAPVSAEEAPVSAPEPAFEEFQFEQADEDEEEEDELDWMGDFENLDFDTPELDTEDEDLAGVSESSLFRGRSDKPAKPSEFEKELRDLGRSSLDDFFSDDEQTALVPRDESSSDLMRSIEEDAELASVDSLFGDLDEDLFATPEAAEPSTGPLPPDETTDSSTPSVVTSQGPDWVEDLRPDAPVGLKIGGMTIEFEQGRLSDLPENFRALREKSHAVTEEVPSPENEELSDVSALAGIVGGLEANPVAITPGQTGVTSNLSTSAVQQQRAGLLADALEIIEPARQSIDDLLDEEEVVAASAKKRRRRRKARTEAKARTRTRVQADRVLITLLLIAIVIIPFLSDTFHVADDPASEALAEEQALLIDAVDDLQPGDYVFIAFEYGPTSAGELNPLAEAVLRDIFRQGAIPVVTSTNPLGALNSRHVLENLAEDEALLEVIPKNTGETAVETRHSRQKVETVNNFQNYVSTALADNLPTQLDVVSRANLVIEREAFDRPRSKDLMVDSFQQYLLAPYGPSIAGEDGLQELENGEDYITLRYLPGGAVGVRALARSENIATLMFARDSVGEETDLDIDTVSADNFAFTIVIGESVNDVRIWAEQFDIEDMTKFALVTASAEPMVQTYVDSEDDSRAFQGYLAGYRDTYRYNQLRNEGIRDEFDPPDDVDIPNPDISQWHSMTLAALLATLIIALGLIINLMRAMRRRRLS